MRSFFHGVLKHIDRLDSAQLKRQYERLSDEIDFLNTLFETITQGIVVFDEKGKIVKTNPAAKRILGMEPEAALRSLSVLIGKASKREFEVSYPEYKIIEIQSVPMQGGTLVYIRDVTSERKRTADELRIGATSAVRELASGVAHEIGNPLNAISLNLRLLEREHGGDEIVSECIRQVERLDGIIKGFLQALRPTRPNLQPGSAVVPIHNCLATLRTQLEDRRIKVRLDVASALPPVAIDVNQMEQVYFNLLKNALEAMKDGGMIEIEVGADDNDVFVNIHDSGGGMTSEQVSHLFEAYHSSKAGGNGLGLMVSARIVRDHGGTIGAESVPGKGTTFIIRLPRLERRIRQLRNDNG